MAAAGAAGRLKLLANYGVGTDHIDLPAARAANVVVTNTPGVLTDDTADMVMALILSVPRRLAEGEKLLRAGEWRGWSPTGMLGHRITGKRLGIIGMGRIGRAVATRARGFGLTVHYHNRHRLPAEVEGELEATWWDNLDAMLKKLGTGLFVTELMGQGTNYVTGDYSRGASGFWVEKGRIAFPVHEITIAGNMKAMLKGIVAVGADAYNYGAKTVGSILINKMKVAGS